MPPIKPPQLERREHGALELDEGFYPIVTLSTDGRNVAVQIQEEIIPQLNQQKIERACELLRDAFYRVRPDLRKQ